MANRFLRQKLARHPEPFFRSLSEFFRRRCTVLPATNSQTLTRNRKAIILSRVSNQEAKGFRGSMTRHVIGFSCGSTHSGFVPLCAARVTTNSDRLFCLLLSDFSPQFGFSDKRAQVVVQSTHETPTITEFKLHFNEATYLDPCTDHTP